MAEQATKDWEPVLNMMHDYKGLVTSWKDILGLYNSMADKHKVRLISFLVIYETAKKKPKTPNLVQQP